MFLRLLSISLSAFDKRKKNRVKCIQWRWPALPIIRAIATDVRSPVAAFNSKYITIYITQTFNNIQNVPYVQD